jgi:hypothetical protein
MKGRFVICGRCNAASPCFCLFLTASLLSRPVAAEPALSYLFRIADNFWASTGTFAGGVTTALAELNPMLQVEFAAVSFMKGPCLTVGIKKGVKEGLCPGRARPRP